MGPRRATAGCCFVLLLGSLPHGGRSKKAAAPPFCSGHGHTTSPSFVCNCTSGWTGPDCSLRVCPVGTSWLAPQIGGSGVAHVHPPFAVCSDMGHCDAELGLCECRAGFEGEACDQMACPRDVLGKTCGGHGACMTLREAGAAWNGRNLVRPHAPYENNWDADKIKGCVCDEGWSGFNCTARLCPTGDDPRTPDQRNEVAHVACQADGGAFRLTFRGHTTTPIAHDAHYGDVEAVLDALPPIGIGGARVFLGNSTSATRVPTVCHRDYEVIARIEFLQAFGRLPALRVEPAFPALSLGGEAGRAKLAMITNFTLRCPACPGCRGALHLGYDGMETRRLAWYTNATELHEALEALPTLGGIASDFGNLTVAVTSDDAETEICDRAQAVNTTITLRGKYGNVYPLELVNEVYNDEPTDEPTNVTLVGTHGTKEDWPCSRHGVCDEALGLCRCFNRNMHIFKYEYKSSNGYNAPGPRGDCGYVAKEPISCPSVFQVELTTHLACNGHGLCDNTTMSCRCEGDFIQGDCSERRCPSGPAWFDEPSAPDVAHASAECSNAGTCERDTGQCMCYPGFRGAACAELDCPRDKTGRACSGNGRCLSAWRLAELADANGDAANFSYGVASRLQNTDTAAWDRNVMHGCACDAADTPATGARGPAAGLRVSGVLVENPRIGGYGGYDCSRRTCPRGDDPRTPGEPEVQTLRCNETTSNFTLTFRQQTTAPIDGKKATVAVLEAALEALSTIADVRISAPAHVPSDRYGDDDAVAATRAPGDRPACNETGVPLRVTFLSEMGDLPMLSASPTMNVSETVKGTTEDATCANRGVCDTSVGLCRCLDSHMSSDGNNSRGSRRDCGFFDPHGKTYRKWVGYG